MKVNKTIIGIIILHFGKWEVTKECLDSLATIDKTNLDVKVIVVDNSRNSQISTLIKQHPVVSELIIPDKNLGFAGGNNAALPICESLHCEYILFLNNDTLVEPFFLSNLLQGLTQQQAAIAGPVIEHKVNGKTFFDFGGYIDWTRGQPRHENRQTYKPTDTVYSRDFVSGCCLLIKIEVLRTLRGFNESYFLYLEDVELCLRAASIGHKIIVVPSSKIFHKGSQSSTEMLKILYSWRNSLKLTLSYVRGFNKARALFFNLWFYPALLLQWKLKLLKKKYLLRPERIIVNN